MNCRLFPLLCFIFPLLVSCQSTEIQREQASQREDLRQMQEKVDQLSSNMVAVQNENDGLKEEISRLKSDLDTSNEANAQHMKDIERLDDLVKKLDSAREQDRKIIVTEVSNEINRLSKKISSEGIPSGSKSRNTSKPKMEEGVEHVVSKGETLVAIAKAYGVSVKTIMTANKLTKSDLKIGQKLFIPKKSS